jgi:signal transduction histidine kinase
MLRKLHTLFDGVSYLVKVPLALCAVSLLSAMGVFALTYHLIANHINSELTARVEKTAVALSVSMRAAIAREEIWDVYQQLAAVVDRDTTLHVLVTGNDKKIIAASDPLRFPIASPISGFPHIVAIAEKIPSTGITGEHSSIISTQTVDTLSTSVRVLSEDGEALGMLVVYAEKDATLPALKGLLLKILPPGLLVLGIIVPIGWSIGRYLVAPINRLQHKIRQNYPLAFPAQNEDLQLLLRGKDEIGRLSHQFEIMQIEIDRNQSLELQIQTAERMALVGKLTSSLAHEINNPLGGMLNVIGNLRLHGSEDTFIKKSTSLLERGLLQIKESVASVLSESKREHALLTAEDFDDLKTLCTPHAAQNTIHLMWETRCPEGEFGVRAVPIRQIVLNLVLNAIKAAKANVKVSIEIQGDALHVSVQNDGIAFSAMGRPAIEADASGRTGLGLWVSFRLVHQLGGALSLNACDEPSGTIALLDVPLGKIDA